MNSFTSHPPHESEVAQDCQPRRAEGLNSEAVQDAGRLRAAADWLQRLRMTTSREQTIDDWVDWSADSDNLGAFERVNAVAQAARTDGFIPLPATPGSTVDERLDAPSSQAAVAALIEQNYVGLRLLVARRCHDPNLAAQLLNEAVVTTWTKWQAGKIERPEQIAGYVLQVTMNLLSRHRRAAAEASKIANLREVPNEKEPDEQTIEREVAHQVQEVIRSLSSPRDRAILVRYYLDEENKASICKDMGLSPLQFEKILHRARGRLRKLLESAGLGKIP